MLGAAGADTTDTVRSPALEIAASSAYTVDAFTLDPDGDCTWNLLRFLGSENQYSEDYYVSSPLQFLAGLGGVHLEELQKRFILIASGAGRAENMGESWAIAHALGQKGVPNRVDPWGADWHHDWVTWRKMLPQYLDEWTRA